MSLDALTSALRMDEWFVNPMAAEDCLPKELQNGATDHGFQITSGDHGHYLLSYPSERLNVVKGDRPVSFSGMRIGIV